MISTVLYAIAWPVAFFFTVFPWFLAAGGTIWRASPFIIASALLVGGLRPFYRRALADERLDPLTARRSPRRVVFGVILMALALPVAAICALGVSEAFRDGRPDRIEAAEASYAENEREIARLENEYSEQANERGENLVDSYVRGELSRRRESRPRLEQDVATSKAARMHGILGGLATVGFLTASAYSGVRSIRWAPPARRRDSARSH